LIFGNVKITKIEIEKMVKITKMYPQGVNAIILMISEGQHEEIDLKK